MASRDLRFSRRQVKKKHFNDFVSSSNWSTSYAVQQELLNKYKQAKVSAIEKNVKSENLHSDDTCNSSVTNKKCTETNNDCSNEILAEKNLCNTNVLPNQPVESMNSSKLSQKRKGAVLNNSVTKRAKTLKKREKTSLVKLFQQKKKQISKTNPVEQTAEDQEKHVCKKAGCGKKGLTCCVKATNNCVEATGKTSRWYHMSMEEHYCNACFEQFYRNKNNECNQVHEWKKSWFQNSRADSNFKIITNFIAEKQLPYWVQCNLCGHWRVLANNVELTPSIVRNYTCIKGNLTNATDMNSIEDTTRFPNMKYSCSEPNDRSVDIALNPDSNWMTLLKYVPYLKNSPAAPFLTGYYPDGVGMSAVDTDSNTQLKDFYNENSSNDILKSVELLEKISSKLKSAKNKNYTEPDKDGHHSVMTSPGRRKRACKDIQAPVEGLNSYFQPFYKPNERGKALCMRPDVMELDEAEEFPGYYKDQTVYLAIRNLIIALWTYNPFQILSPSKCCHHLILRGLTRVRLCSIDVPQILSFATRKGLVNLGCIKRPEPVATNSTDSSIVHSGMLPPIYSKQKVIVVGAGPAGLAAARQLTNFGCDVICLEARDRIGGRVCDDWSLDGVCVGKGAQIINGCINNPLALISHQLGLKMHVLRPRCDLFDCTNNSKVKRSIKAVSCSCDKRMDFHFNALLDIIVEWRQAQAEDAVDCSLGEKIQEAHKEWMKQSGLSFNELEERLLDFHIGNLEFACGASLNEVSAFHWDQNEIFSQFSGDHTFLQYGFGTLLNAVSQGIDIRYKMPVTDITIKEKKVEVKSDNQEFSADRVLVTVPLTVLRSGSIRFSPPLPRLKQEALDRMGCGCIEKAAMLFPTRFWEKKIAGANYFGYVPAKKDKKGFFSIFYDVPYPQCEKSFVLMSIISGEAVERMRKLTDAEVIKIALNNLKDIFPEENVPKPKKYFLTRWRDDPYAQMAYSYVKCGSSGNDYDEIAKDIDEKIFFAGEGTNRHFPQTVTGAYLSGVREASKIVCHNKLKSTGGADPLN